MLKSIKKYLAAIRIFRFKPSVQMESKESFYQTVLQYYRTVSNNKIPTDILEEMSLVVATYHFEQYSRFRKKYTKSIKRYSSMKLDDLDHPYTRELIIKFFKNRAADDYPTYAMAALNFTKEELEKFEKNREDFYRMF